MTRPPRLGTCYFPEHWPDQMWADDARRMADIGLQQVRMGEFAWSRIEPAPGQFNWAWLDRAIDILATAGLDIVLCTPTATPPKWLIDAHPDILAWDRHGRPRKFGSRRHYCFSSSTYRAESARITTALAARYGEHSAIKAWQTDNEYGCHDTVRSYSPEAERSFRLWLRERYGAIDVLNESWGTSFWSQTYRSFDEINLPNLTVTEPNPSHRLDFYRFSSDQVVSFNRVQTDILRRLSPGRDLMHNFMGFVFDFDHFQLSKDLDIAAWDSYPIGFLDAFPFSTDEKRDYLRQGHPDVAAFHHDLYRSCGAGRWQVIEQQPGPVNWAANNPAPLPGMVRLWTHEAVAHGAEAVSYFRWRQLPFGQEQMHAGLERPDGAPAPAFEEARTTADDLARLDWPSTSKAASVALVFSYEASWVFETHPQGAGWSYRDIVFAWYSAARRLGFDIDIVSPDADLAGYRLVLVPSLPMIDAGFVETLRNTEAQILLGPRTGSKTPSLAIPEALAPGPLQELIPIKITHSESLPEFVSMPAAHEGEVLEFKTWLDHVETDLTPIISSGSSGIAYQQGKLTYLAALPAQDTLVSLISRFAQEAGLEPALLPDGVRTRRLNHMTFAFNYADAPTELSPHLVSDSALFLIGNRNLPSAGVAVWCENSSD